MKSIREALEIMWKDFGECHEKVYYWVDQGLLKFNGKKSQKEYTELDAFILRSFGFDSNNSFESIFSQTSEFDMASMKGELATEWLFGEHGLTLYKALLIRKGMYNDG